jgi:arginine:pyruvate transaminase
MSTTLPPMRYASRTTAITRAAGTAWELSDRAAQMAAVDEDVILLTIGDVDRDTPARVIDTAVASLRSGRTHYAPIVGDPRLRSTVARSCSARLGREVSRDQVVIFPGAQCALFSVMQCLAEPGDEVILLEPSYATYETVIAASGAQAVRVSLRGDAGFELDVERIAAAITPRCRAILVNSPNNPCGAVFSAAQLGKLVTLCAQRGLWLVSDEVYGRLTFDAPHVSPASLPGGEDCVVVIDSLSKSHAMTGWRIGWAMGPAPLAHHLADLAQAELFSSPPFVQDAAVVALEEEHAVTEILRATYLRRRDAMIEGLGDCPGLRAYMPRGGMFVLVDVSGTGLSSRRFAEELLTQEKVAVISGDAFGASVADTVRVGLTQPEERIREACRRIRCFVTRPR